MTRERRRPSPWWATALVVAAGAAAWGFGVYRADGPSLPADAGVAGPSPARVAEVAGFWEAVGAGDVDAVLAAMDDGAGDPVRHYAAFAAGFSAGFLPEDCRAVGPDTVRCLLQATNPALLDLSRAASVPPGASATVTLTAGGIGGLELPEVVNSASIVLFVHAREHDGVPAACDRIHHDALDLPPFNTTMAQTGECARALVPLIPDAIASLGP